MNAQEKGGKKKKDKDKQTQKQTPTKPRRACSKGMTGA
jgi:hypothetical protein